MNANPNALSVVMLAARAHLRDLDASLAALSEELQERSDAVDASAPGSGWRVRQRRLDQVRRQERAVRERRDELARALDSVLS